jgi:hypothetical protein
LDLRHLGASRLALGEVLVADDPLTMLGQHSKNELSGNGPVSPAASRKPTCPVVVQSMPDMVPSNPDGEQHFFSGLLERREHESGQMGDTR